jgi:hypothetical protein
VQSDGYIITSDNLYKDFDEDALLGFSRSKAGRFAYKLLSTRRAAAPRLSEGIKRDSQYDNDADDNLLIVGIYIHEHEPIQQDSDQNRSNDCTGDSSQAAKKTRAADDHGGNDSKFVTLAGDSFR